MMGNIHWPFRPFRKFAAFAFILKFQIMSIPVSHWFRPVGGTRRISQQKFHGKHWAAYQTCGDLRWIRTSLLSLVFQLPTPNLNISFAAVSSFKLIWMWTSGPCKPTWTEHTVVTVTVTIPNILCTSTFTSWHDIDYWFGRVRNDNGRWQKCCEVQLLVAPFPGFVVHGTHYEDQVFDRHPDCHQVRQVLVLVLENWYCLIFLV